MINGKTARNRKVLQKTNRVQVLKLTATMHCRFIHTWWDYLETQWPHWSTFSISSRLVKKHSSNNLICRSTPGFPMYHKRFGHSNVKGKKIQSHVWSPWSHIANLVQYYVGIHVSSKAFLRLYLAVISVATILIRLEIFIVSHDIQQLLANYLRLFLENVVQLL